MSNVPSPNRKPTSVPGQPGTAREEDTIIAGSFRGSEPERTPAHLGGAAYNFQPSEDVRKRYFATRKHSFNLAGITFPGLFTEPSEGDLGWFKVAVGVEIVTALILSAIVVSVYDLPPIAGLLPFLGFVGIDLALAIGHHWLTRAHCLHENQELLVVPDLRAGARIVDTKYGDFRSGLNTKRQAWHGWLSGVCVLLIIVMAVGKTLFLSANIQELGSLFHPADSTNIFASHSSLDQVLQRSEYRTAILVIFSLLYGLVAYIHIKHTGYALSALNLVRGLKRDRRRRDTDPRDKQFHCVPFRQVVNLRTLAEQLREANDPVFSQRVPPEDELEAGGGEYALRVDLTPEERGSIAPHTIEAKADGSYIMTRQGILTDEQLQSWVNMQATEFAGQAVALYGHKLQLNMVGGEDIDKDIFR